MDKGGSVMNCIFRSFRINGVPVSEQEFNEYKQQRKKENNMTDNKTETIPHLALRRQWLDDIEKDPKCVWGWRDKGSRLNWISMSPGVEPAWRPNLDYSPQPKTKTYYMVMVKHSGVGQVPFGLVFEKKEDIEGHLKRFHLDQVGDVVPREVEQ